MRRCIKRMNNPEIGDYYMCTDCKLFLLTKQSVKSHTKCTKRLLQPFVPADNVYRCTTCGRYFETQDEHERHEALHKELGNYHPTRFSFTTDEDDFVVNLGS